jgi:hypothetical protein
MNEFLGKLSPRARPIIKNPTTLTGSGRCNNEKPFFSMVSSKLGEGFLNRGCSRKTSVWSLIWFFWPFTS